LKIDVQVQGDNVSLHTNAPVKGVMLEVPVDEGEDAI
jgi:hypothetical protein